ncbi:hypothetical protein [Halocynthiibacter sp.]|uniref:hypothetical protein n=1 Tax=Halocynthiibacter sp. TaxID=1979210 RepID=UPI003C549800
MNDGFDKGRMGSDGSVSRNVDQIAIQLAHTKIEYEKMISVLERRIEQAIEQENVVDKYTRYLFRMIAATAVVITLIVGLVGYVGGNHIADILSAMKETQSDTSALAQEVTLSVKATTGHTENIEEILRAIAKSTGAIN